MPSSDSDANNPSSIIKSKKMELANKKLIRHAYFGEKVTILFQGYEKIKVIEKPDFINSLKPFVDNVITKL